MLSSFWSPGVAGPFSLPKCLFNLIRFARTRSDLNWAGVFEAIPFPTIAQNLNLIHAHKHVRTAVREDSFRAAVNGFLGARQIPIVVLG